MPSVSAENFQQFLAAVVEDVDQHLFYPDFVGQFSERAKGKLVADPVDHPGSVFGNWLNPVLMIPEAVGSEALLIDKIMPLADVLDFRQPAPPAETGNPDRVKVKTRRPFPLGTLNDEVKEILERIKGIGTNLTFEGEYLADFVERLDRLVDVKGLRMDENVFKILIGDSKGATPTEILSVVTKATLLNVSAAGYEDASYGKILYFEFYIPPWNQQEF